ncbi:hypothetical protein A1O7_09519 [Cladophialophora yegresii CBS 114405]|uniref:Protein N-terminal and lysine N-methyltransferase EFM7 n=1 Tax=Cladophialophora yegresii CBS 114405 TaxID=1182544 RepID=W9VEY1_9EURO|nr:uncharacterized protein A1O7_09519 [Cladophialophora yegresii CBS 114405]EXJ54182.1 hypothetical protein A1O7_09519 [Cladophialophora yegresii CBS 114405]
MAHSDDDEASASLDIFREPADFFQPEKPPTFVSYTLQDGNELRLRLVGHSPLWGHLLWNAGQVVATYLEDHARQLVQNKSILELGAGSGLPSLVAALLGARKVVVTDYPDQELVDNLRYNIEHCSTLNNKSTIVAEGYLWGSAPDSLKSHINPGPEGFDLLILADILFNHSEHTKLLRTVRECLKRSSESVALVFFTPYRPWLLDKDLDFFELARKDGFVVKKLSEQIMDKVMFENDPGDELLRRTVFGYQMEWQL